MVGTPIAASRAIQVGLAKRVIEAVLDASATMPWWEEVENSTVFLEAVGVVAAITASNYPLHLLVSKVAPAMMAGCALVVKPGELAPLAAARAIELLADAGLPSGVVNLVLGGPNEGSALIAHPEIDAVSFTGSTAVGRLVAARRPGAKAVLLELGDKSANVLLHEGPRLLRRREGCERVSERRADLHRVDALSRPT